MLYSVYVLTNTVNGKCYVGSCYDRQVSKRRTRHLIGTTNRLVAADITEYGRERFEFKVICQGLFERDAKRIESQTIIKLASASPNGYNIRKDGQGGAPEGSTNPSKCQEVRDKISKSKIGNLNPMKRPEVRKKHSQSVKHAGDRTRMSKSMKGIKNPMFGKPAHNRISDKKADHIRYLYQSGIPVRIIVSIVQVSDVTVYKYIK